MKAIIVLVFVFSFVTGFGYDLEELKLEENFIPGAKPVQFSFVIEGNSNPQFVESVTNMIGETISVLKKHRVESVCFNHEMNDFAGIYNDVFKGFSQYLLPALNRNKIANDDNSDYTLHLIETTMVGYGDSLSSRVRLVISYKGGILFERLFLVLDEKHDRSNYKIVMYYKSV